MKSLAFVLNRSDRSNPDILDSLPDAPRRLGVRLLDLRPGHAELVGLQALELAPKKAAGTAAGFTSLFGYLGGAVAASAAMGYTVDHFGWDSGFVLLIGACILAMAFLAPTPRHKQVASTVSALAWRPARR